MENNKNINVKETRNVSKKLMRKAERKKGNKEIKYSSIIIENMDMSIACSVDFDFEHYMFLPDKIQNLVYKEVEESQRLIMINYPERNGEIAIDSMSIEIYGCVKDGILYVDGTVSVDYFGYDGDMGTNTSFYIDSDWYEFIKKLISNVVPYGIKKLKVNDAEELDDDSYVEELPGKVLEDKADSE